jgi:tripartite-type tricarboxylate transporter receptor subunit TctC
MLSELAWPLQKAPGEYKTQRELAAAHSKPATDKCQGDSMYTRNLNAWGVICFAITLLFHGNAYAQSYPARPITIIVGFGAGGAADAVARLYAQKMSQVLHTSVIVENKPGANQLSAIRSLQLSPADGYTLYLGTGSSLAQAPAVRSDLGYDPLKIFSFIAFIGTQPGVFLVNPSVPARSIDELIAYAKAHPGELNFESSGLGSASHLETEYFMRVTGIRMTQIPYKSDAEAIREIAAGTVPVGMVTAPFAMPLIKAGKVRPIMVVASQPNAALPNVPALPDMRVKGLLEMQPYTFFGLVGPSGMPGEAVTRLSEALNQVATMPDVASRMRESFFIEPATGSPASFRAFVTKELSKWREFGSSSGIKISG